MKQLSNLATSFTVFLLLTSSIIGCASFQEAHDASMRANCRYDVAYTQGFEDGKNNRSSRIEEFGYCPMNTAEATRGYREGFEKGFALTQPQTVVAPSNPTSAPQQNNGTQINIGIGGVTIGSGNSTTPQPAPGSPEVIKPNPKAYYCKITAFAKTFESFGPTLLEAKLNVLSDCKKNYSPMFCQDNQDLICQKNQ